MKSPNKTSIVIADDHALVRDGLAAIIGYQKDLALAGLAQDGKEAVALCKRLHPDVALVDLMMPGMGGAEATAEIRRVSPGTHVLIVTSYGDAADLSMALENGASGVLSKTAPKEELFDAIRRTASGESVIADEFKATLRESQDMPDLTARQREILESLSRGLTNADIARQHGLSQANVKFHLLTIFRKLNVANRAEAVSIALRKHLLKI